MNDVKTEALEQRVAALEKQVAQLLDKDFSAKQVDNALKRLGRKIVNHKPQFSYFNLRFREYELMMYNVKNLVYQLGHSLSQARSIKVPESPPQISLLSKVCTQADMNSDWFYFWSNALKKAPTYHRKQWELVYIAQALWRSGKLAPGRKGLGFGCGAEPLPSLFAKYGVQILATDLAADRPEAQAWIKTGQHADTLAGVRKPDICPDPGKLAQIDFRPVDMNAIPTDLAGQFDFCWSACALEHLGSIAKGLEFIENSLKTLKPGGVAVHTTEYNFAEGDTLDGIGTIFYQKQHLVAFADALRAKGYKVAEFDFSPGDGVLDGFVDIRPYQSESVALLSPSYGHLRNSCNAFACTSVGMIVTVP